MSADVHDQKTRSFNMSRIRGKNTKPEIRLRSLLHRQGFRFRNHVGRLPGKPDIVLPKYHTVIFVHGCFWHRHEGCRFCTTPATRKDFWDRKFSETVHRDRVIEQELKSLGWRVLTIWECDLKRDPEAVIAGLTEELKRVWNR